MDYVGMHDVTLLLITKLADIIVLWLHIKENTSATCFYLTWNNNPTTNNSKKVLFESHNKDKEQKKTIKYKSDALLQLVSYHKK